MKLNPAHPAHLVIGLSLWSIWFVGIYSALSLYCDLSETSAKFSSTTILNTGILLSTAVFTALFVWAGICCWRAGSVARISAGLYWAAAIATLAVGGPVLYLPPCL